MTEAREQTTPGPDRSRSARWAAALFICYATGVIVALGLSFGRVAVRSSPHRGHAFGLTRAPYANWDGQWYVRIAAQGYSYDPETHSSVAFFPAYPLLGRLVAQATGLRWDEALVLASNAMLAVVFVLFAEYLRVREGGADPPYAGPALLALGLIPTGLFLRVAYSESLFLLVSTVALYGIRRGWPPLVLALVVGLATATRMVGVALVPALAVHLWRRSGSVAGACSRIAALTPVALWGLVGYMIYQYLAFGDPLAFARTQEHWRSRPPSTVAARAVALTTFEPIRTLYDPEGPAYAETIGQAGNPFFCLRAADPIYFLSAAALVALGAARRWLSPEEVLAAAGMLIIPYTSVGYEQYMQSMGRYSAVVLPAYIVLGRLLAAIPGAVAAAVGALAGFFLGVYAAMFAAWHLFL